MGETSCPDCGASIESKADLENAGTVSEIEEDEESFSLHGNKRDLFLCSDCRNPMGVGRRKD